MTPTNTDYYESYLLDKIAALEADFHRAAAPFYKRLAEIYAHKMPPPVVKGKMYISQDMREVLEKEINAYEIKEHEQ